MASSSSMRSRPKLSEPWAEFPLSPFRIRITKINANTIVLMNRRSFLRNAIAGFTATQFLTQMRGWAQGSTNVNGLNMPIGFQSYVFREEISQKPRETMGRLASYGYRTVEWCSPKGYQGPFTPLVKYSGT